MLLAALIAASWLSRWADDPVAVTTVVVAVVGGGFALYRFRFVPSERRRETLDAMQKSFKASADERAAVLPDFPPFLAYGRDAVGAAAEAASPRRADVRAEVEAWRDLVDTASHEILASEAKFRSLLWAVHDIQRYEAEASADERALVKAAERLVAKLNDFAQLVELNLFPQSDVLSHLHRAIAPACKSVEPLVWARNLDGRWGLRVPRLMLRAEYYNDVKRIHRSSDLMWKRRGEGPSQIVLRSALYRDEFGRPMPSARLSKMSRWKRLTFRLALRLGSTWVAIRHRYGGSRLRQHRRHEDQLVGWLRYAVRARLDPCDLDSWNMQKIKDELETYWRAPPQEEPAHST